jgi:hypothetical protein
MTKKNAELVRVVFSDGHELLCTPDHKLLSSDNKWVEAINSKGMICHDAVSYSGYWKCRILNIRERFTRSIAQIHAAIMSAQVVDTCTGLFIKTIGGQYRTDITFTTKTILKPITSFSTWRQYLGQIILQCIKKDTAETRIGFMSHKNNGANLSKEKSFLNNRELKMLTSCMLSVNSFANAAVSNLKHSTMETIAFAPILASLNGAGTPNLTMSSVNASTVQEYSKLIDTLKRFTAHALAVASNGWQQKKANNTLKVLRVESVNQRSDVYCLEVPSTEAFALANGAVVHNCRYAMMMLRYSRPDTKKADSGMKHDEGNHQYNYNPLTTDAARGL